MSVAVRSWVHRLRGIGLGGAGLLVVVLVWGRDGGGFGIDSVVSWGALLAALLLVLTIARPPVTLGGPSGERRIRTVVLVALVAFVAWNYLSLQWADVPSDALIGSNKTAVYAVCFLLPWLWPWRANDALVFLGLFVLGVSAIGAVELAHATIGSGSARAYLQDGRPLPPIGYVNANVALWMMGFWPAVLIGSLRRVPTVIRASMIACAALLLELSLLGESRGWFFLTPLAVGLFLLTARQRMRVTLGMALPLLACVAVVGPLLRVYEVADRGEPVGAALDSAAAAVWVSTAGAALAGLAWALVDRRTTVPARVHRLLGFAGMAALVLTFAAGGVMLERSIDGHPQRWVDQHWADFTRGYPVDHEGQLRFTGSLGTDRYLQWRVAVSEFRDHPLIGIGSDNYAVPYTLMRNTDYIDARYPHSTPLRLLSQLGLVGTVLFSLAVGLAVLLALRRRRRLDVVGGGVVGVCLTVFGYWLLHGSIDWLWEIPALAAPAFALLGVGASLRGDGGADDVGVTEARPPADHRIAPALTVVAAMLVVGLLGVLGVCWAAERYAEAGLATWRTNPARAYALFERSADLDRVGARPFLLEGSIALRRHDLPRADTALRSALAREPLNWYAWMQLGLADVLAGRRQQAAEHLDRAQALNPADTILRAARKQLRAGGTPDPEAINALYLKELNRRLGGNPHF